MRFFTARLLGLATLVPALAFAVLVSGCAKQSEGERCGDDTSGPETDDCGDGLTCKPKGDLLDKETHRCCYTDGHVSDSRCEPAGSAPVSGTAGSGGSGAEAGGSSVAGGGGATAGSEGS